jgi:hypothetical protein
LKDRLISELNKRFDLDIDNMMESPKLRLKLSPAELDKQLLELYNTICDGPRGDLLRKIGGGSEVAFQTSYIKRKARKLAVRNAKNQTSGTSLGLLDSFRDENDYDVQERTASQWVNWALRRNLPKAGSASQADQKPPTVRSSKSDKSDMTMSLANAPSARSKNVQCGIKAPWASTANRFCPPRNPCSSLSILI